MKIREDLYGRTHISMAVVLNGLGTAYLKLAQDGVPSDKEKQSCLDQSLKLFERSLAIRKTAHGGDSVHLAPILSNIGNLYKLMNKSATAIQYLSQYVLGLGLVEGCCCSLVLVPHSHSSFHCLVVILM